MNCVLCPSLLESIHMKEVKRPSYVHRWAVAPVGYVGFFHMRESRLSLVLLSLISFFLLLSALSHFLLSPSLWHYAFGTGRQFLAESISYI